MKSVLRLLPGKRPVHPESRLGQAMQGALCILAGFMLVLSAAAGLLYLRLSAGPLEFAGLPERVATAIAGQIGPGWDVALRHTTIELDEGSLALRAVGLEIRDPGGAVVVRAPHAIVSVDTLSLLVARVKPRAIEFRDLQLHAALNADGSLSFGASGEKVGAAGAGAAPVPAPDRDSGRLPPADPDRPSRISAAVASLFDLVLEPSGIVGALDRARLKNARLTIVDAKQRERATFNKLDASFERLAGMRRFTLDLEGPVGRWSLGGEVREDAGRRDAVVTASNIPVADLLLFGGGPGLPGKSDLALSARAEASFFAGRVTRLESRIETGGGTIWIDDKDVSPIPVQSASVEASWDESRRALALRTLAFEGGGSVVRLQGELALPAREAWRLSLAGRDGLFSGLAPADATVKVESVEAELSGQDGRVSLDRLLLRAPDIDGAVTGEFTTVGPRPGLRVTVKAASTSARAALRLWPEPVASPVRRYLVANFRQGTVEKLDVEVALTQEELVRAFRGDPIPDSSVKVEFGLRDAGLFIAEGLPALSKGSVSGTVTGTRTDVRSPSAVVDLPDGRALALLDAAFRFDDFWAASDVAKLAFRLEGGADAFAVLLQTPSIRSVANVELDPSTIKGRVDLRVALPLAIDELPSFADLPISASGTVSDLSIDKLFGRERLENGQLALSYDAGGLQVRGEGRLGGAPAAIEVRQPRGGPGEASVLISMDDAARARRGLSFGNQLTGAVSVRAIVPLEKDEKRGLRIEADLGRATVDHVIPGWTKAAGRPGKLSFTVAENNHELRDLVLESGPVQVRGGLTLSPDGQLDRAEFSSFKLSPGDDTKVRLERSGNAYRINVRGPVADARPFVRSLSSPASGSPSGSKDREVDLDVAVNILTGFNEEAVTGATIKASIRGRDLRQFQLNGRFRGASVSGQVARPDRGRGTLVLKSDDAGATLRYFDIYRRMVGGTLTLQVSMGEGPQTGSIAVDAFALRNEPALKRIITQQPPAAMSEDRAAANLPSKFDINEVGFTRAQGNFTRTATRLDFTEAVIWGPQVGFTLGGWIDYGRDRTDITGTFVPAYGLNNVLSQVPLFGPLLSGGQHEGLFAINFRVSGVASAPTLTVNPLSAVAPGFLRKLFGAGGPGNPAPPPTFFGAR